MMLRLGKLLIGLSMALAGSHGAAATLTVDLAGGADHTTIQEAIDAAEDGDTVLVRPGRYLTCVPLTFRGKAVTVRAAAGPVRTALLRCAPPAGDEDGTVIVFRDGEGPRSVLEGFTVAGYVEDLADQWFSGAGTFAGGGIRCERQSSPTLRECVIAGNEGQYGGGLACLEGSAPKVERCRISWNKALGGGGVYVESASPLFEDCSIVGNVELMPDTGGGGIRVDLGAPRFVRCRIAGNLGGCGSAVHVDEGLAVFENCTIFGHPVFAIEVGCSLCSGPMFINCTVGGNEYDGPVCHRFRPERFLNCILASNWQADAYSWSGNAFNLSDRDPRFVFEGVFDLQRWSLVTVAGRELRVPDFIVREPDFHLLPDSPAIDAGSGEGASESDIEGLRRPLCSRVDIGAHEFSDCGLLAPRFLRGDCNDDGTVDISDATMSLGWLFLGQGDPGCDDACDSNDDGSVDTSDAITTLGALFLGQGIIPLPGVKDCGADPSGDGLDCGQYQGCP